MKIYKAIIITILVLVITIFSVGAGHGTYIIAKVVFPYTMIIAQLRNNIEIPGILIAIFQIPIYAYIANKKSKWTYVLIALHCLAIIACFTLNSSNFR